MTSKILQRIVGVLIVASVVTSCGDCVVKESGEISLSNGQRLVGYVEGCGATTSTRLFVVILDEGEDISSYRGETVMVARGESLKLKKLSESEYYIGYMGVEIEWKTDSVESTKFIFGAERMKPYVVEVVD